MAASARLPPSSLIPGTQHPCLSSSERPVPLAASRTSSRVGVARPWHSPQASRERPTCNGGCCRSTDSEVPQVRQRFSPPVAGNTRYPPSARHRHLSYCHTLKRTCQMNLLQAIPGFSSYARAVGDESTMRQPSCQDAQIGQWDPSFTPKRVKYMPCRGPSAGSSDEKPSFLCNKVGSTNV